MSKTLSIADAKAANIKLTVGDKGGQAVHDLVIAYRANRRSGTAHTKTRGEVKCSGKKIYRQKGTGGARHGARSAPIFVGGGVVFGPRNTVNYKKTVNKGTRKLALSRVLTSLIEGERVLSADAFAVADGKTKSFIAAVKGLTDAKKVLIVAPSFDVETYRAGRNVQKVQLETAASVNVEQLLHADKIVVIGEAIETLAKRTA